MKDTEAQKSKESRQKVWEKAGELYQSMAREGVKKLRFQRWSSLGHEVPTEKTPKLPEIMTRLKYNLIMKLFTFDISFLQQLVWLAAEKCVARQGDFVYNILCKI